MRGLTLRCTRQPSAGFAICRLRVNSNVSHLMSPDDEAEIAEAMRLALRRARGYADFFGWAPNRDLEEQDVLVSLAESLTADSRSFFTSVAIRGRGNDPPDLEARDFSGRRIAFEITELVDGDAIRAYKQGRTYETAEWMRGKFQDCLSDLLVAKSQRFDKLKGAPYPGGYVVVVFTDETGLPRPTVEAFLREYRPPALPHVDQAFLVLSYDPSVKRCPYFTLAGDG